MSSKTKIVVLHMKEVIYTAIFLILTVSLIAVLFVMFGTKEARETSGQVVSLYTAGVYTTPITLNGNTFNVEVTVDSDHINSIALTNLSETTTAMYPLMEPTLEEIAGQVYVTQSLEGITYTDDNKYTSMLLLDAISTALEKASVK